jgi:hypothetical protein
MVPGNRRLYFHGFLFFAIAPVIGFLIMAPVANPRAMLGLHVTLWLSGALICAAAAAWGHLQLGDAARRWTERGLIAGIWVGLVAGAMSAFMGTKTDFAGGGTAPEWAETLVQALQLGIVVTLVPALALMAVGLGRRVA